MARRSGAGGAPRRIICDAHRDAEGDRGALAAKRRLPPPNGTCGTRSSGCWTSSAAGSPRHCAQGPKRRSPALRSGRSSRPMREPPTTIGSTPGSIAGRRSSPGSSPAAAERTSAGPTTRCPPAGSRASSSRSRRRFTGVATGQTPRAPQSAVVALPARGQRPRRRARLREADPLLACAHRRAPRNAAAGDRRSRRQTLATRPRRAPRPSPSTPRHACQRPHRAGHLGRPGRLTQHVRRPGERS